MTCVAVSVPHVSSSPIDDAHLLARIAYRASHVKASGEPLDLDFEVSNVLATRSDVYEIFAFVTGVEMALYREFGLLADANAS